MEDIKLKQLVEQMTVREKLGQLTQLTPEYFGHGKSDVLTGPASVKPLAEQDWGLVGSVLNCTGAARTREIQQRHLQRCRHGIPLLFMADIIHGYRTIFPIPLAAACSFRPEQMTAACRVAAAESAASGIHVTFSPMADLVRDPRWGRVMEGAGEDPLLNGRFAAAAVRGYQNDSADRIAACVKHFAAYGAPEGGREYNNVELCRQTMEENYLPGYKAAVDAGVSMVMAAFNTVDRIPATANTFLQRDILRRRWGFDGVLISDYNAVEELCAHGVARSGKQAAALALDAGIDIEMMSTHYLNYGEQLVAEGRISMQQLDDAVLRVLRLKNSLGLFEDPFRGMEPQREISLHLCADHRRQAREAASLCPVLLKNEKGVLPLLPEEPVGLAGPFAASRKVLGGWSAGSTEGVSLWEGICAHRPSLPPVLAADEELGSLLDGITDIPPFSCEQLAQRLAGIQKVIVAVGENQNDTGEGASKTDLRLTPRQEQLIHSLKQLGKTVIAVVFSGRPLELEPILENCDALLQAWFLGSESGNALSDLLFGVTNPSGKLCISIPRRTGQIPVYYSQLSTGRPDATCAPGRYASRYIDCPNSPLFPFGYGLTYGDCVLEGLSVPADTGHFAKVTVTNRGQYPCTETVQLYIGQRGAPFARPEKELRDFQTLKLQPGECREITFPITKPMLQCLYEGQSHFFPGEFSIMVGLDSQHTLSHSIEFTQAQYDALEGELSL